MSERSEATFAEPKTPTGLVEVKLPAFGMLLQLESLNRDEGGVLATFLGKPSTHGNRFSVPINDEAAAAMTPGREYLFVLVEER